MNMVQWVKETVIGGHCTLWPDGVWSGCCKQHDLDTENGAVNYVVANWWLAACVHASSYSPAVTSPFWRYAARYAAPPVMFVCTSTFGWFWRFRALYKMEGEMMKRLLLVLPFLLLSGCANNMIPVSGDMVGAAGDMAWYVKDASVAKELAVHATLRNRDKVYRQMYPESGTKITFQMVETSPGVFVQTVSEITSRDAIVFKDPLPTQPSAHPVWGVAAKVLPAAIDATLIGTLGYRALSVLGDGWKATAPVYNGPVGSFNPTTTTTTSGVLP